MMVTVETNSGAVTAVHIVCWNNLMAREIEGANCGLVLGLRRCGECFKRYE